MSETQVPIRPVRRRERRPAAVEIPIARADLEGFLDRLESGRAAFRLAQALELDTPDLAEAPGRLAFFHEAFTALPDLQAAAAAGDVSRMRGEWVAYAKTQSRNARFWHALAALWRERMIHLPDVWTARQREGLSALWLWLMCSAAFWEYFGADRHRPSGEAPREKLPPAEARELFEWTVTDWLQIHRAAGGEALFSGAAEKAASHFRCLKMVEAGEEEIRRGLRHAGWEPDLAFDAERLSFASRTAAGLLGGWEEAVLTRAVELVAGKQVPAAVALLETCVACGGGSLPVLIALLDAHLKWAEAEKAEKGHKFARVDESAKSTVARLESMAKPDDPLERENVLLAAYHVCRGLATEDLRQRLEHADAALKWDSGHVDAQAMHLFSRLNLWLDAAERRGILEDCQKRGFDPSLLEAARQKLEALR